MWHLSRHVSDSAICASMMEQPGPDFPLALYKSETATRHTRSLSSGSRQHQCRRMVPKRWDTYRVSLRLWKLVARTQPSFQWGPGKPVTFGELLTWRWQFGETTVASVWREEAQAEFWRSTASPSMTSTSALSAYSGEEQRKQVLGIMQYQEAFLSHLHNEVFEKSHQSQGKSTQTRMLLLFLSKL